MSGHNPHSRVSQPVNSSSWNHLQVPSYMPRQPQLAHMSSERTLRSSPLIWPNTNPADTFYNYMALTAAAAVANSNPKNTALDMNPLLPFLRTPTNAMTFNSVDLSLSSTTANPNRNSLTPSPRNHQASPGSSTSNICITKSTNDGPDDSTNNAGNNKLNNDPIAFLNEMSEQLASMRSNRNLPTPSTIPRDTNSDLSNFRINGINDMSKQRNEPMEIGREPNTPANPFENESLSNSVHLQQLLGLTPPITSSITPNLNDLSKSLLSIFNNTSQTSPMLISPKSNSNFLSRLSDTSKNCLNTSNDDSLDSQSGACNGDDDCAAGKQQNTRYRRRKQQKTVRMSNDMDATIDNEKTNIEHSKNDDHHKGDGINNSNGINFPAFHSETNSILSATNSIGQPPQTQSIDLSHHCANPEMFQNGLVNYSKPNDLNLSNPTGAINRSDKDANLLQNDETNGLNLFGTVNFGHLRGTNLTNDIATFPNTDDLVKKVEELVKCNEQNGFENNDFGPMELTKSHVNKLISNIYVDDNRIENGIIKTLKPSNNIENQNNHSKCNGNGNDNGNGITSEMISDDKIEYKIHKKCHDGDDDDYDDVNNTNAPILQMLPNTDQNGEINTTDTESAKMFEAQNAAVLMYDKLTGNMNNESNVGKQPNDIANSTLNDSATGCYSNDANKGMTSVSSSESPSNASSTPKKKTVTKKRTNGRLNGKKMSNNKNNQKNAKLNDKSEKKSDIKKAKSKDDSAAEALNKFRGPYVHIERDGTLNVINAPLNEEIAEKQSKFKKNYISQRPIDRNKVRGLHVSTLSNKYDAVTTDISWMCVFCKLGPHKYGLGDLFGPFILSTESEDFQLAQIDPNDDIFKSHRNKCNIAFSQNISAVATKSHSKSGNTAENVTTVKKKRKLNQLDNGINSNLYGNDESNAEQSEIDIFYGMTRANDSSYEVWAHEDCIVWASGVHIIGARVVGLETAVWDSVRHQCGVCKQFGAMLSCLQRNCNNEVHVPCAKRSEWNLDERSFQSRCNEHTVNDTNHNDNKQ